MATLLEYQGISRTVLTSRRLPIELVEGERLQVKAIHALSLSEAAVLARQLPNLGKRLRGDSSAGVTRDVGWRPGP